MTNPYPVDPLSVEEEPVPRRGCALFSLAVAVLLGSLVFVALLEAV